MVLCACPYNKFPDQYAYSHLLIRTTVHQEKAWLLYNLLAKSDERHQIVLVCSLMWTLTVCYCDKVIYLEED